MRKDTYVITKSPEETERFAKQWGYNLVGGDVVLLHGDLGAGKTHFVKGIALALGIEDIVTSPTFTLHNMYYGKLILNHFDFYRVDNAEEVELLGLNEFFGSKDCVCAIEWSQNIVELLPQKHIDVVLDKLSDLERSVSIHYVE